MLQLRFTTRMVGLFCCCLWLSASLAHAQPEDESAVSPKFQVSGESTRLEMIVNTSRILEMDFKVPRMIVNNPDVIQPTPLAPNEVQVSALKPGVTQLNLWDEQGRIHTVDVLVIGDARELMALLESQFPDASLKVTPLSTSVVISGYVPSADMMTRIVQIAEDYYPTVINNLTVGGAQQVLLQVQVYEVSRTKLRSMGFDWAYFNGNDGIISNASGLIRTFTLGGGQGVTSTSAPTLAFGIVDGAGSFFGFLEALRQYDAVKVLAQPNLVTVSGRAARFNSGGEFPILIPQSLGTLSVEYREFGTRVDFVPIVLGNGYVRLEVRPEVSEIDDARSVTIGGVAVPALRTRYMDTAVEMKAGQTLALGGLLQTRTESQNRGLPIVADLPWVGALFRRVEHVENEIELLILVTPEFVDAVDPCDLPSCYPGQFTASPDDCELYGKGYLEVPNCPPEGMHGGGVGPEQVPPGRPSVPPDVKEPELQDPQLQLQQSSIRRATPAKAPQAAKAPVASVRRSENPARTERSGQSRSQVSARRAVITDGEPKLIGPIGYQQRN